MVELIVVIVILAILIGVTISGVYRYVNTARRNNDLHNAEQIEKILSSDFVTGTYFNSKKFKDFLEYHYSDIIRGSGEYSDINNGNAVYILKWDDYVVDQFKANPEYADFPMSYYRTLNCVTNRAWYVWRWLAYNSPADFGCNSQSVISDIPVAKQGGFCFYLIFNFTEDGSGGNLECVCAPSDLSLGSSLNSRDLYDALQSYKMITDE